MHKVKLGFAMVCMVGFLGLNSINAFATELNSESVTQSETNRNQKEKKTGYEDKMIKASEKWKTLTVEQKQEIYALLDDKMQANEKVMDKLVEFGLIEKADAIKFKTHMLNMFVKLKESGEFPLLRQNKSK